VTAQHHKSPLARCDPQEIAGQTLSTVQDPETPTFEVQLNNVGDLEATGLEVDVVALLTENFRMNLGFAYTDTTIK
jgi:outer membrane receptor protein involved in Fe transport